MEQFGLALILFAAFWVGCAAGYIAMRLRAQVAYEKGRSESAAEISTLTERLSGREQQLTEVKQRADSATESLGRLEAELRTETDRRTVAEAKLTLVPKYEAEVEARGQKLAEQQKELTRLHASVSELGTRLEESKKHSAEKVQVAQVQPAVPAVDLGQQQALLGQVVEPLKSSLDRVDARIGELERERAEAYANLRQQVESMMRTQASLQAETAHLASALRTPSSRGRWGEVQLRRVVELAGMIAHCDFVEPRGTEDAAARPDLIVQLPNHRQIVVDSKISLDAYLASNDVAEESERTAKRRQHAANVRAHVEQLSAKGYWDQFPQSPEFVIAFLPGEAFFSAALEHDPALLEFGVERRVILATPTTLIALLRAVAWGWKQELVSSNAKEIRDLGKSLYDRLRTLAENFTEVQRSLSRTTAAFNRTVSSFEQSVIPAARRMRDAGASTGDEIVSPPPVDSTPRSLHLLAEAADMEENKLLALTEKTTTPSEPVLVATAAAAPKPVTKPAAPAPRPVTAMPAKAANGTPPPPVAVPAKLATPAPATPEQNAASPVASPTQEPSIKAEPVKPASPAKPATQASSATAEAPVTTHSSPASLTAQAAHTAAVPSIKPESSAAPEPPLKPELATSASIATLAPHTTEGPATKPEAAKPAAQTTAVPPAKAGLATPAPHTAEEPSTKAETAKTAIPATPVTQTAPELTSKQPSLGPVSSKPQEASVKPEAATPASPTPKEPATKAEATATPTAQAASEPPSKPQSTTTEPGAQPEAEPLPIPGAPPRTKTDPLARAAAQPPSAQSTRAEAAPTAPAATQQEPTPAPPPITTKPAATSDALAAVEAQPAIALPQAEQIAIENPAPPPPPAAPVPVGSTAS